MIFNSYLFFGFFALVAVLFDLLNQRYRWGLLLLASLVFSLYAAPVGLLYILFSSLVTYFCTIRMERQPQRASLYLILDVSVTLGILFLTKYLNFFSSLFSGPTVHFIVPLGISFYTFMIIGYAADVSRGTVSVQRNYGKLLLFTCYFPQMLTGPISRYGDVQEQLFQPPAPEYLRCRDALILFTWGLFKKCCIADNLSVYVNLVYNNWQDYHGLVLFSGPVVYAIFLYADFSGCIDMARGISQFFGIELKQNFRFPYFADSVEDFWRRWHITLSSWFKDYLFYPLMRTRLLSSWGKHLRKAGNKKLAHILPTSCALFVVWLFTGFWHGAKGTYLLWGLYFGVFMILSNIRNTVKKNSRSEKYRTLRIFRTFLIVCFGYIFFNAQSVSDAFGIIRNIFSTDILNLQSAKYLIVLFFKQTGGKLYFSVTVFSVLFLIIHDLLAELGKPVPSVLKIKRLPLRYCISAVIVFFLLVMMNRSGGDFTYMQF